jgi:hypothetical protein
MVGIGLALEFAPPWQSRRIADAYLIRCELTRNQLVQAAADV